MAGRQPRFSQKAAKGCWGELLLDREPSSLKTGLGGNWQLWPLALEGLGFRILQGAPARPPRMHLSTQGQVHSAQGGTGTDDDLLEHDSRRNGIGTAGLALGFLAALGKAALAPVALKADSFQRGLSKRRAQELLATAHRERLKAGKSK